MEDKRLNWSFLSYKGTSFIWSLDDKFLEAYFDKLILHDPSYPINSVRRYHVAFDPDEWFDWKKFTYPGVTFWLSWPKDMNKTVMREFSCRLQSIASQWNT